MVQPFDLMHINVVAVQLDVTFVFSTKENELSVMYFYHRVHQLKCQLWSPSNSQLNIKDPS